MHRIFPGLCVVLLLVFGVSAAAADVPSVSHGPRHPSSPLSADLREAEPEREEPRDTRLDLTGLRALSIAEDGAVEHATAGRHAQSARCLSRAAEIASGLGWPARAGALLRGAGDAARLAGDYGQALSLAERRLALEEEQASSRGIAASFEDLGRTYALLGDDARAIRLYAGALSLRRTHGTVTEQIANLIDLAASHQRLGDAAAARTALVEALALSESSANRAAEAATWTALGRLEQDAGTMQRALSCHRRAVEVAASAVDDAPSAAALEGLAAILHARGALDEALVCCRRARALYASVGDSRGEALLLARVACLGLGARDGAGAMALHEEAGEALERTGAVDASITNWVGSARAALAAGEIVPAAGAARAAVEAIPTVACGLSEEQGAAIREARADAFELGGRASLDLGDARTLFFFLEAGRAGTLLEFLSEAERRRAVTLDAQRVEEEHDCRVDEARALDAHRASVAGGLLSSIRSSRMALTDARDRLKEVLERMQRESHGHCDVTRPAVATLARVQEALGDEDAFVSYGVLTDRLVAVIVRSDIIRVVRLGDADVVTDAASDLGRTASASAASEALATLRETLVNPLALADDVERVLVSPDGSLHFVPFAALHEDRDVVCVPSATSWLLLVPEGARRGRGVLSVGDPYYGGTLRGGAVASVRSGLNLTPLPASRHEARAVGDVVLLGADATEPGLRFALGRRPRWRALHLACHGLVDQENPTLSSLALTSTPDDDGFLTALDVFRVAVPADLVVLSACHSGRGRFVRGEGALGLMRAFLMSGTPRVLVSLGEVDDESTGVLMERFYGLWKAGVPTAAALRQAQAFVRSHERWAHPHYWAGWSLWGLAE